MPNISKYALLPFGLLIDSDEINWPLLAPDGSISAPSYSFASGTNDGLYAKDGGIYFAINGADAFRLHPTATTFWDIATGDILCAFGAAGGSMRVGGSFILDWDNNAIGVFRKLEPSPNGTLDSGGDILRWQDTYTNGLLVGRAAKTTTYVVAAGDSLISADATAGAFTVNLPAAASHTGRVVYIKKTDSSANAVTVDGNASETIDGALTQSIFLQYECLQMICNGTGWEIV